MSSKVEDWLIINVLQIDVVINNGVSFYNSSTEELQDLAQRNQINRQFAATRDSMVTVVKRFQDLIDFAQKEGLVGAIGYARVKAQDTLVVSNSSYYSYSLCSQCPSPLLPGTPMLILDCFPSFNYFNTTCALN